MKSEDVEDVIVTPIEDDIGTPVVEQKSPTKKSKKNKKEKPVVQNEKDNVQSHDDTNNVKKPNKKDKGNKNKQLNKQATNDSITDVEISVIDNETLMSLNKVIQQDTKNIQPNANGVVGGGNNNATEKNATKQKKSKKNKDKKNNNNNNNAQVVGGKDNLSTPSDDIDKVNTSNLVNAKNEANLKAAKDKKNKADKNKLPSATPPPSPTTPIASNDIDDDEEKVEFLSD